MIKKSRQNPLCYILAFIILSIFIVMIDANGPTEESFEAPAQSVKIERKARRSAPASKVSAKKAVLAKLQANGLVKVSPVKTTK